MEGRLRRLPLLSIDTYRTGSHRSYVVGSRILEGPGVAGVETESLAAPRLDRELPPPSELRQGEQDRSEDPDGIREFGDVVESGELLEAHFTVRSYVVPAEPAEYDGPAVRAVRERYAMSQGAFARVLCVSSATIQSWEQGRRVPSPIARRFLDEMAASPEHFQARFAHLAAPMPGRTLPAAKIQPQDKSDKGGKRATKKRRVKAI